jgi:hypothetical protein
VVGQPAPEPEDLVPTDQKFEDPDQRPISLQVTPATRRHLQHILEASEALPPPSVELDHTTPESAQS